MIRFRNRLMPPADISTLKKGSCTSGPGRVAAYTSCSAGANPIRHYRMGLDCNCTEADTPYKESGLLNNYYTKDYCPSFSALKKVRNSGGSTSVQTKSNSEYLKSRAMTYDQKKYHHTINDAETEKNRYACQNPGADSSSETGCTVNCYTTWKPNNKRFAQDGAVSNSSYLNNKKYDTIQKVANSMSHFDHSTMVAYAYSGRAEAPFTAKSKMDNSMIGLFRRRGNKNSIRPGCGKCI